jgi:hypothetical protein
MDLYGNCNAEYYRGNVKRNTISRMIDERMSSIKGI